MKMFRMAQPVKAAKETDRWETSGVAIRTLSVTFHQAMRAIFLQCCLHSVLQSSSLLFVIERPLLLIAGIACPSN